MWVHFFGLEQAELVVMAKHPWRHLAEPGELSDVQHDSTIRRPSHNVKVKTASPRLDRPVPVQAVFSSRSRAEFVISCHISEYYDISLYND
jgi:hypothetical protein